MDKIGRIVGLIKETKIDQNKNQNNGVFIYIKNKEKWTKYIKNRNHLYKNQNIKNW